MFHHHIEAVTVSPQFRAKVASLFPVATSTPLHQTFKMSGDLDRDLSSVVSGIGKVAYLQRRERSLIHTGLTALRGIQNGD